VIVTADGRRDRGCPAHQPQGIGDIAGGPAEIFLDPVDLKTDVEHVDLVRQYMVGKYSGKFMILS